MPVRHLFLFALLFLGFCFFFPNFVSAAGLSFPIDPALVKVGETAKVNVTIDPQGSSINIVQLQLTYDPSAVAVQSCVVRDGFKGIAGQQSCSIATKGVIQLQVESTAAHGPTAQTRVAVITVRLTGTSALLQVQPGAQLVGQNAQGESQMLPVSGGKQIILSADPSVAGAAYGLPTGTVGAGATSGVIGTAQVPMYTVPPLPEKKGFFSSLISWFQHLFGQVADGAR